MELKSDVFGLANVVMQAVHLLEHRSLCVIVTTLIIMILVWCCFVSYTSLLFSQEPVFQLKTKKG
jgi:hypothetical protein